MAAQEPIKILNNPGIRRDGTLLEGNYWSDGQWVRFDRGRPRKMRGFKSISNSLTDEPSQITTQTTNGNSYIHLGYTAGIDSLSLTQSGLTTSVASRTPSGFTADPNITWQFATIYDPSSGLQQLIAVATYGLIDPYNTTVGNGMLNSTTNGTNLYNGSIYASTALTAMSLSPNGTGAKTESSTATGVSGGVVVLNPYTILYGANGYFAWSTPSAPLDFRGAGSGSTNITAQKILKGLPLRAGGSYSPAGLFWSVDSLIRVNFVGGSTIWQYDTLSAEISLLNANCVVENDGAFYWAGADGRFYRYNGSISELPNEMNLNWFYDNLNTTQQGKCFACRNPRWGEIWWCYPRGNATQCTHAVIYNYRKNTWYDTAFPISGRSFGVLGDGSLGVIMSGSASNNTGSTFFISGIATGTTTVITTTATHTLVVGGSVALSGIGGVTMLNNTENTITATTSNTFTINVNTSTSPTYTSGGVVKQQLYTLWQHEKGTDAVSNGVVSSIDAYIETSPFTMFNSQQPTFSSISASFLESDFIQSGPMTVTIRGNASAQGVNIDSQPYVITPPVALGTTAITPLKETRRQMRFRFESNVAGGDFQMGDCWLHFVPSDKRLTT